MSEEPQDASSPNVDAIAQELDRETEGPKQDEEHPDQAMQVSGEQDLVNPNIQMGTQSTGF